MSKEILLVVEAVANEKGVEKDVIFGAIEAALAAAARKRNMEDIDVRVSIDRESGDYETFRRWQVLDDEEEFETETRHIMLKDALDKDDSLEAGDYIEEQIENPEFGRIAAQAAKQVIVQRVREAERAQVVEAYQDRVGELINGTVKRVDRGNVYVDLGGHAEGFIPREHTIMRESIRPGDRIRAFLYEVRSEHRGPQLFMSRTRNEFLIELFRLEVPEIGQGLIEIIAAARDPGLRAKIAVKTNDQRTDPIGACVGMRGSRVQAVSNELSGERVDIILHDENSAQYVINAMAPAEVVSIIVDEESQSMDLAVDEDKLSQAIGRGGQNVRLASELTGWHLNVMSEGDVEKKSADEAKETCDMLISKLDVDEEIAMILVQEGFSSIEEVAYVPESEMIEIEEFDEDIVKEIRSRARDALLTQLIAKEERMDENEPAEDLLNLEGMDERLAYKLAEKGIKTQEELAECAVDDIKGIHDIDEETAAALIMTARAPWFEEDQG